MKSILELYQQYQIMPQLCEHQLRVAGVAALICENFEGEIDSQNIISACLLHDMGNIIKFDLSQTKNYVNQNINLEYWVKIQREFKKKYGNDEHRAHQLIAQEIGVSQRVLELIGAISFLGAAHNAASADFGKKIVQYSDDRVVPKGVVSLEERFIDLRERYRHHGDSTPERDRFEAALREIQTQIFARSAITPADISQASVAGKIEILKNYQI